MEEDGSGKGAPSAAMLELTASSMAAAWCWLERTGDGRRSERQRVERSAGLLAEQARRRVGERHGHWRPRGSEALQLVSHDELQIFQGLKELILPQNYD